MMKKECISNDWYFKGDWDGECLDFQGSDKEWCRVNLPHDYAMIRGRSRQFTNNTGHYDGGSGRYKKYIKFDKKQHIILDIDGAYMCAEIRINNTYIDMHPHGYTPYLVDMTDEIKVGCHNRICIKTDDNQPSSRWYSGAGLYRDVYLWRGGDIRIEPRDLYVTTKSANHTRAELIIHTWVSSDYDCEANLRINIEGKEQIIGFNALKNKKTYLAIPIAIDNPRLWDIEKPNLYKLEAYIEVSDKIIDEYEQFFGIREITVTPQDGLRINGRQIKLQGGCIHHDHGGIGACAYPAAEERKIRKLQKVGFNAVRIAHNPPSTALMEVCDSLGMLVITEAFDMWNCEKTSRDYHLFFKDWCLRDIKYMVERDRSHPCVIFYSIGNEIIEQGRSYGGAYWAKVLSDEIRKYDASRPVTAAVCELFQEKDEEAPDDYKELMVYEQNKSFMELVNDYIEPLDIVGYNYLFARYDEDCQKHADLIIWGSETHAITFFDSWNKVMKYNNLLGDFTWTAIDNIGETGAGRLEWDSTDERLSKLVINKYPWRTCFQGDFDLAGFRRPQSYFREAIWKEDYNPKIFVLHPKHYGESFAGTGWHWYDVVNSWSFEDEYIGKKCTCHVYTLADEVRFILNGKEIGSVRPEKAIAMMDIPYQKGILEAEIIKGGKIVSKAEIKTTGIPAKVNVLPEKSVIIADGRDLCYFDIQIEDDNGYRVVESKAQIKCSVEGGKLLSVYSGCCANEDVYNSNICHVFCGRAVAVVKTKTKGNVKITVSSEGLKEGTAIVSTKVL